MAVRSSEITDLTVCRALLAGWVFLYHVDLQAQFAPFLGPAAALVRHGYLGVDGFFILSGLIMTRVHTEFSRGLEGAGRFWGRRLARIYPVHLATILILLALLAAGTAHGVVPRDPARFSGVALLQNLLLVHGWGFLQHWTWNYPSWAVSSEWAGYLLFPFVLLVLSRWPLIVSGNILILILPLLGLLSADSGQQLNVTFTDALPRFFMEFLGGITTMLLVRSFADYLLAAGPVWFGFLVVAVGAFLGVDLVTVIGIWLVLTFLMIRAYAEAPPQFGDRKLLRGLGLLSYSFYMSFGISELLLAQLFRHQGWDPHLSRLAYAAAMTLLTLLLASLLFWLVERPCRRLGDRLLAPAQPVKR